MSLLADPIMRHHMMERFPSYRLKRLLSILVALIRLVLIATIYYVQWIVHNVDIKTFIMHPDMVLILLVACAVMILLDLWSLFDELPSLAVFIFVLNFLTLGALALCTMFMTAHVLFQTRSARVALYTALLLGFTILQFFQFIFGLLFLLDLYSIRTLITLAKKETELINDVQQFEQQHQQQQFNHQQQPIQYPNSWW